jgi:hypothetical protein
MSKEKIVQELKDGVDNLNLIISQLEGNDGWNRLLKLFGEQVKILDDSWHLIPTEDTKRLIEARCTKMAYSHILGWVDMARADIQKALQTIKELESPDMED